MNCPECGAQVQADERFCGNCGAALQATTFDTDSAQPDQGQPQGQISQISNQDTLPVEETSPARDSMGEEPYTSSPPPPPPVVKKSSNNRALIIVVVVLALLLLCCCLGIIGLFFVSTIEQSDYISMVVPSLLASAL